MLRETIIEWCSECMACRVFHLISVDADGLWGQYACEVCGNEIFVEGDSYE